MGNNQWGKWSTLRKNFEIQKVCFGSLPLSRLMMPKVPICSSFQRRKNGQKLCVLQCRAGCCEISSLFHVNNKKGNLFYEGLTHSRKQKHTPTHTHTHRRNVYLKMSSSLAFTLELHYASREGKTFASTVFNQLPR
jgi:hypothetical protein